MDELRDRHALLDSSSACASRTGDLTRGPWIYRMPGCKPYPFLLAVSSEWKGSKVSAPSHPGHHCIRVHVPHGGYTYKHVYNTSLRQTRNMQPFVSIRATTQRPIPPHMSLLAMQKLPSSWACRLFAHTISRLLSSFPPTRTSPPIPPPPRAVPGHGLRPPHPPQGRLRTSLHCQQPLRLPAHRRQFRLQHCTHQAARVSVGGCGWVREGGVHSSFWCVSGILYLIRSSYGG